MARLVIFGQEGQTELDLTPVNTLGRHPNNSIQLLDRIVSKEHCVVEQRGGRWILRDLGSLNGTYINDQRVSGEAMLQHGDQLSLGNTRAIFQDLPPAPGTSQGLGPAQVPQPATHGGPPSVFRAPTPAPGQPFPGAGPMPALNPNAVPPLPHTGHAPHPPQGPQGPQGPAHLNPFQQPAVPSPFGPPQPGVGAGGFAQGHPAQPFAPNPGPPPEPRPGAQGIHTVPNRPAGGVRPGGPFGGAGGASPGGPLGPFGAPPARASAPPGKAPGEAPKADPSLGHVTIGGMQMESHVRTKFDVQMQQFLPEKMITDPEALRRDYEKLRVANELQRAIAGELDLDRLLKLIVDRSLELLSADRGVVLLYEGTELKARCSRARRGGPDEFIIPRTVVGQVVKEKVALLTNDAKKDDRFVESKSIIITGIRSSMAVPLLHKQELLGLMMVDSQNPNAFGEKDLQIFTNIANQASLSITNAALAVRIEEEAIARARFQRLLSPSIAELVVSGKVEVKQGGEPRVTTMLFTDIRGFTARSETMPAEEIVTMLNEYFELMVEIVFAHEGTLDKFVGDEIMALFGAPVSHPDDALRAVRTALTMLDALRRFNDEREARGQPGFAIGIGVNTGEVVAGYIGSSKAMQYTVIGAPVNLAARLCSHAAGMQVLISEDTWREVREHFEVRELEPIKPKGIAQPVRVFEVLGELSRAG
jgi:adenylate cyclase